MEYIFGGSHYVLQLLYNILHWNLLNENRGDVWNTTAFVALVSDPLITINVIETEQGHRSFRGCTIEHSAGSPNITLEVADKTNGPLSFSTLHRNNDQYSRYAHIVVSKPVELTCTAFDNKGTYFKNQYLLMSGRTTLLFSCILELFPITACQLPQAK